MLSFDHTIRDKTKQRNRDPVVDLLVDRIADGFYTDQNVFPTEQALCDEFTVSRTVAREVVQDLIGFGLIETRPRVGAKILPQDRWDRLNPRILRALLRHGLDASLYEALREARWLIEPEVAAMAAARADDHAIRAIDLAFDSLAKTVSDENVSNDERVAADLEMHRAVLAACGNWVFQQFGPIFDAAIMARMALAEQAPRTDPPLALEKHRAIVDAIKARNPGAARRATLSVLALSKPAFADYFVDGEDG